MTDVQKRFISHLEQTTEPAHRPGIGVCWEWTGRKDEDGYGQVKHEGRVERVPRVAYMLFVGVLEPGTVVLHECDNPSCGRPSHLRAGTQKENMEDKVRKGRQVNANSVLSSNIVDEIREAKATGEDSSMIAHRLGVAVSTVNAANNGQNWKCRMDLHDLTGIKILEDVA